MITCRKSPCSTCPYRADVPSGIWAATEYAKLPAYDLDTTGQAAAGATGAFLCHQRDGNLCAGWVSVHDMRHSLGLRLLTAITGEPIDPAVYDYVSPLPLFATGREAAEHGLRDISNPGRAAQAKAAQLMRLRGKDAQ